MDDNTKCVLVFLIATISVVTVFYLLITQGSTKGQTLESMSKSYNRARTWDQKVFAGFASFGLLLKTGAWGAFGLIVVALINGVVTICGHNAWSFWLAVWDRFIALFTDRPAAPAPSPSP